MQRTRLRLFSIDTTGLKVSCGNRDFCIKTGITYLTFVNKILVVINPVSGNQSGSSIFQKVRKFFQDSKLEVVTTTAVGEVFALAFRMKIEAYDQALIVGGDGTINEFVNGMMRRDDGRKIALAFLPAGTGNSLMHHLGLLVPGDACRSIVSGARRRIDLLSVTTETGIHYAFNVVGWGLPSTVNKRSEKWKFLRGQRYNMASLLEIVRNPSWPVEIEFPGKVIRGKYCFFMACNTIYTGKGMKIAPDAILDDGEMDVVMLRAASRHKLVGLFSKIFKGRHIGNPLVEHYKVQSLKLSAEDPGPLIIDGQVEGSTPFQIQVLKQELEICH